MATDELRAKFLEIIRANNAPPIDPTAELSAFVGNDILWTFESDTDNWEAFLKAIGVPWVVRKMPGMMPAKGKEPDCSCKIDDQGNLTRFFFDNKTKKPVMEPEVFTLGESKKSDFSGSYMETVTWSGGVMQRSSSVPESTARTESWTYVSGSSLVDISLALDEAGDVKCAYVCRYKPKA
ncbi:hypothetical protein AB1Y20_019578 [Prymnesium parvum]|uniref:Uncharacterized protein n=1 Tax=Prymnesium parvum TaxID=97485 RepID=A0AB34JUV2_PRYPA